MNWIEYTAVAKDRETGEVGFITMESPNKAAFIEALALQGYNVDISTVKPKEAFKRILDGIKTKEAFDDFINS